MTCTNDKPCACPKSTCANHKKCCECIKNHRETDSLPFCMFPENGGDKSNENFYRFLDKRFKN